MNFMWQGFVDEVIKLAVSKKRTALGIPDTSKTDKIKKVRQAKVVPFVIQKHKAEKAGTHYDLRIGEPETGRAHSWALRHLPQPGEKRLAVRQPTHTIPYMEFSGVIPEGYGAGKVEIYDKSPAEILYADDNKINFNTYPGRDTQEYSLIHTSGDRWLLINRTPTRKTRPDIPDAKPKYKEIKPDKLSFNDPDHIMMAKIDGAHNVFELKPGKNVDIFSYRPTERATGIIEHTARLPDSYKTIGRKEHGHTILRGEVWAIDPLTKKPIEARTLGGLLNSNVLKSRELQKEYGKLRAAIFDVVKYKGKDFENAPYEEKLKILDEMAKKYDMFELPDIAYQTKKKEKLFADIANNRHKQTREGVVLWNLKKPAPPIKVKLKKTYDVKISGIFQKERSRARNMAGGFEFNEVDGVPTAITGRVGTGFSNELRKDMIKHPDRYIGLVAAVTAQEQMPSGVLRAPAFENFHLDKNDPSRLSRIVLK